MQSTQVSLPPGGRKGGWRGAGCSREGQAEDSQLKVQGQLLLHEKYSVTTHSLQHSLGTSKTTCLLVTEHETEGRNNERKIELHL